MNIARIPVDTGRILLLDPAHLPEELLEQLLAPNTSGVTVAVLLGTGGDGWFDVQTEDDHVAVIVGREGGHVLSITE